MPREVYNAQTIWKSISIPLLALSALYFSRLPAYRNYFPFGDDLAVFQASAGDPKLWFTQGFSRYFIVYPEWSVPSTDFMRPGVNLIIRINQLLFGHHYALYFASYYAAQFLVCSLVVLIAQHFGVKFRWLIVTALIAAINPAFIGPGLQSSVFAFDVWCGLFAIFVLYAILKQWYGLALASLTLALFTKEASLYAPIAASVTVFLCTRRKLLAASMLAPLAIWVCARNFLFTGSANGIYAIPKYNLSALLGALIRGLLLWPTGILRDHAVRGLLLERQVVPEDLLIGLANLVLWVLLSAITIRVARESLSSRTFPEGRDAEILALLIWLAGALSFGVTVGQESRFGGSIYPLEIIFCVATIHRSLNPSARKLAMVAIMIVAASFLWSAQAALQHRDQAQGPSMNSLITSIRQHPASVIYVLNAPPSFSSPSSIASLSGTFSKIVILSESSGCTAAGWPYSTSIQASRTKVEIVSTLPSCSQYEFDGVPFALLSEGTKGKISRGKFASYDFPDANITGRGIIDAAQITSVDMGKKMEIEVSPQIGESYAVLYYDWRSGQYESVGG
jgi:hypothetical protein